MKRLLLFAIVVLLVSSLASAQPKHISVLSVTEDNASRGGVADVYLEVRSGGGAVYIDSFPLTKLDTQLSARFARDYACRLSGRDCSTLDFFFVIRSHSTIIGGPSAGGAMTVLSYAALENLDLREDTAMTGTINSGGLIGPVGGVDAKSLAAQAHGFNRVLVPALEFSSSDNVSLEVIPVSDIEEAVYHFTGEDIRSPSGTLEVPAGYTSTMEEVSESLCSRAGMLSEQVQPSNRTLQLLSDAALAAGQQRFYSAASFCFAANLDLREKLLDNRSQAHLRRVHRTLDADIEALDQALPEDLSSLADLEVYMIVRERLLESHDILEDEDYANLSSQRLSYALERYHSAVVWSSFFGAIPSEELSLSDEGLASSCRSTLAQAEERLNYIVYLTSSPLPDTRQELENAHEYHRQEEWALCLFAATKARAEADSIISALYAGPNLNASVQLKLEKAQELLSRSARRGHFPILSYSYYEYAQDLDDVYSANLYSEYALGLGGLDMFLPPKRSFAPIDPRRVWILLAGVVIGFAGGFLVNELLARRRD